MAIRVEGEQGLDSSAITKTITTGAVGQQMVMEVNMESIMALSITKAIKVTSIIFRKTSIIR